MVLCLLNIHSPQAQIKERLQSIPDENLFIFKISNGGAGYIAVNDASKALRRNAKIKARENNPGDFTPHLSHTLAGFDMLPAAIKNRFIRLSGSNIKSRDIALGISHSIEE